MKQRVKLAQAIVHDPQLVFLDEPTNGMDPQGREDMLDMIRRLHYELGIAVVLSSHLLEDVEHTCEYVVMLDQGRLVVAGRIEELMSGGGDIVVRVDGDPNEFTKRLRAKRLRAVVSGNDIIVSRDSLGDELFDVIRDTAVELDYPLRLLRARQRSLEDVYIQTVGGGVAPEAVEVAVGS
jgi:ABC-2 type transport system ATP-binding protein